MPIRRTGPKPNLFGWIDHPDRHAAAALAPTFRDAAPACMQTVSGSETDPVLLYKALTDVLGSWDKLPWVPQKIGDCTSFGTGHGNDCLQCVEIVLQNEANEFLETCTEAIYGLGREVAGMTGRRFAGDGCYGAAVTRAMVETGVLPRAFVPSGDGGATYDGSRAKSWGYRGVPDDVRAICQKYKLGGRALVKTWEEYVAAMKNGYPVAICSSWGGTYTRDANGFISRSKNWPHCMVALGVRFDIEGACIFNSWPLGSFTGPTPLGMWEGSFWVSRQNLERILSEGDSFALSKAPDFKPRALPAHWTYADAA